MHDTAKRSNRYRMRVLHIVKTAVGAGWAADQAAELVRLGVEVHVALPTKHGRAVQKWLDAGAILHIAPTSASPAAPWSVPAVLRRLQALVASVQPDLIHSHFCSSTVLLRLALGAGSRIPRLFQVPGPLHLEHGFWRTIEIGSAGPQDLWIASSRCIYSHYRAAGIRPERLYLSYYGMPVISHPTSREGILRRRYGIADSTKIVGNANFIYPPKRYLGQRIGLKAHEDVIDALGIVFRERPDVMGVLIGGTFLGSTRYERRLQARAREVGNGRILMTGYIPSGEVRRMWPDFDVAVHVPISENCGGVVEPLLATVPTIAGRVGGLPEVVMDGITGRLVPIRSSRRLAEVVLDVLGNEDHHRDLAQVGCTLVRTMFDIRRTAREIFDIYHHVLGSAHSRPDEFDALQFSKFDRTPCTRPRTAGCRPT